MSVLRCLIALTGPSPEIHQYLDLPPEALIQPSKNQAKKFPEKVWALPDGRAVVGAQIIPEFTLMTLKKTGVPVLRSRRGDATPVLRLIFMPGLGADVSHMGTTISSMRLAHQLGSGEVQSELAKFLISELGGWSIPFEIVAFDLPGAGWGPRKETDIPTYIADMIRAIDDEEPMMTIAVTRSGSGAPTLVAKGSGAPLAGMVMTASTFPDRMVLDENFADIKIHADAGEYVPNWDILHRYARTVLEPGFVAKMRKVAGRGSKFRILSIVGEKDGQTSVTAQQLWNDALRIRRWHPFFRNQVIVRGAGHFVFQRTSEEMPQVSDSDVQAYLSTFRFIRDVYHGVQPEVPEVQIQYLPL